MKKHGTTPTLHAALLLAALVACNAAAPRAADAQVPAPPTVAAGTDADTTASAASDIASASAAPAADPAVSHSAPLPDDPSTLLAAAAADPPAPAPFDFLKGRKGDVPLQDEDHPPVTVQRVPVMFVKDMAHIFVSPIYLRPGDLKWLLPLTGATIASFATDTRTMRDVVSQDPNFNTTAGTVSDALRDTYIGVPVLLWAGGQFTHNDHVRETGILGGQAMLDAFVVDEVVKVASFRERPNIDNARGDFYVGNSGGLNSSFVSGHCMIAWSAAEAMASEYNNKWVKTVAYTGATGVAVTRVLAREHFPTDVLLGSAGGWLIGHYVYRAHHHAPHGKVQKVATKVLSAVSVG